MKPYSGWLALFSLFVFGNELPAQALTAVNDQVNALPNAALVIPVLTNDVVVASNQTAILRVTQPLHGTITINQGSVSNAGLSHLFEFAATQLSNTVFQLPKTNVYPWTTMSNGEWTTETVSDNNWITGFFPGALWLIYQHSGDTNYQTWAEKWMAAIAPEQFSTNTDDVGFMINTSYGNAYRLTGNAAYKAVVLQAAQSFSNRFNHFVGCLADDTLLPTNTNPPPFQTIMDTMMNTELLYNAHNLGGSTNLYTYAVSHAGRAFTNQIRADGSTYHMVIYNYTNGAVLLQSNRVPIPALDTWAREHSWAIHAFTMVYQETGDARFLSGAEQTANFYINSVPSDYVPWWYYTTNGSLPDPVLRDSSAASIALSGLFQLSQLETNSSNAARFWQEAINIYNSLGSTNYLAQGTTSSGILLHGDSVDTPTDCSLIYGDYYFVEALTRLGQVYDQTTVTYVPKTNFSGADSFTYQACDSAGNTSTATVSVLVGAPAASVSIAPNGCPIISFPTAAQGSYFVQYANSLAPPVTWSTLSTNIPGTGSTCSVTNPSPAGPQFYRVGVAY